jgi:glycosyltransferase involved in cell wall biosynthesis
MKLSIITVCFNAASTIEDAIKSVASQSYEDIEHIIIDGASSDGTVEIIERHIDQLAHFVSEPDQGIYDAMNKGIALATGEVIGILNADDVYEHDDVLSRVMQCHQNAELDACYADLVYVDPQDLSKVERRWISRDHVQGLCFKGWMPAHPTLFLKRRVYDRCGVFDTSLKLQSDLEFCARIFESHKISSQYVPELWVRMRAGGASNNDIWRRIKGNWESYLALQKLGLKTNPVSYFIIKFAMKLPQWLNR